MMKLRLLISGLIYSYVGVAIVAADPNPFPLLIPAALKISYTHDMGGSAEVELRDRKLVYKTNSLGGTPASGFVEPTIEEWSKFISELNAAKVYKWDEHYKASRTADDGGFYWSVEIQIGERHFASDGNTAVPADGVSGTSQHLEEPRLLRPIQSSRFRFAWPRFPLIADTACAGMKAFLRPSNPQSV